MVLSHLAVQFLVICLQAAITLAFALLVFGVTCRGPVGALVALTLLQGTAGMAYGEFRLQCYRPSSLVLVLLHLRHHNSPCFSTLLNPSL